MYRNPNASKSDVCGLQDDGHIFCLPEQTAGEIRGATLLNKEKGRHAEMDNRTMPIFALFTFNDE